MNDKTFDARDVGTLATGIVLHPDGFRNVPELFQHVMGHPVWTHEMPDLGAEARRRILAALPDFPNSKPTDWQALSNELIQRYPNGVTLPRGDAVRRADPITTLQEAMEPRS